MNSDAFFNTLKRHYLNVPESAVERLELFANEIIRQNRSLNLVSTREVEHLWERHFLDSLAPLFAGVISSPADILDIGSGAGLPGIPLAVFSPKIKVTMIESNGKKARFIERMITQLKLDNAEVIHARYENLETKFDYCLIRAVFSDYSSLGDIAQILRPGGSAVFYRGRELSTPCLSGENIDESGFSEAATIDLEEALFGDRCLVVFTKA